MHLTSWASALLLSVQAAVAAPTTSSFNHVPHEKREASAAWIKRDRVHGDVKLPMRIGLTQSNLEEAHEMIMEVSHPDSVHYGKYYTAEEVTDIFKPTQEAIDGVLAWLQSAGIEAGRISQSTNKQWLQFDAKSSEAEWLLKAKYHFYEHAELGTSTIACDQ